MKVTPISQSNGAQTTVNPNEGKSASAERVAKAKAVATGQDPAAVKVETPHPLDANVRKIKMNTQKTPAGREWKQEEPVAQADPAIIPNANEPVAVVSEDPKPLDPQVAAILKRERAAQVKEAEISKRELALAEKEKTGSSSPDINAEIIADPLGFVLKRGVTWEQLTKSAEMHTESSPGLRRVEDELRAEIKSLKEANETRNKELSDSESLATDRALASMQRQADQMIASEDAYQMIRETLSNKEVTKLIKRVFDDSGEIMDVKEALEEIENDLIEQGQKFAKISKVQKAINPEPVQQQIQVTQPTNGVHRQTMRTLTNRDTVSSVPSARERAIAAFHGKKLA